MGIDRKDASNGLAVYCCIVGAPEGEGYTEQRMHITRYLDPIAEKHDFGYDATGSRVAYFNARQPLIRVQALHGEMVKAVKKHLLPGVQAKVFIAPDHGMALIFPLDFDENGIADVDYKTRWDYGSIDGAFGPETEEGAPDTEALKAVSKTVEIITGA